TGPLGAGSYKPTSIADDDNFPTSTGAPSQPYNQPAPAGSSTLNGVFGGTNPNGTWQLYTVDNFIGDTGAFNGGWSLQITTDATATTPTVQFSAATYSFSEGVGDATLTVTRSGDTTGTATVNYASVDNAADVRCDDTTTLPNVAFARCDYATSVDT